MDDKDLDSRTEMSHSRSRRKFLYAVGGAGIVSAAGLALMGAERSATKIDHRRSQMESPIEVVRRFCAAWADNIGAAELAAFFTDDAVYHNIPLAPVTGREAIANTSPRSSALARQASRASSSVSSTSQPMVRSS